ncbi:endonuclease [Salinicola sp. JS01]|uniref:endonuclease n=1 Tax=Salinicola sp. JS01 TaxID=3050071 RepID=UPI00255C1595|nr:endonuclease [Salinicola sp. JS01]WIX33312.1 endonuclease [Salinicola sp. JS01]
MRAVSALCLSPIRGLSLALVALCLLTPLATPPAQAAPPSSFSAAKRLAESEVYVDQDRTFYCDCAFDFDTGPDLASCGYQIRKQPKRAARIEWEHVMPAYDFGRQRQCWQEGGRRHCRANDPVFRQAEADLVNLVPSVGEVNGDRSNMRYGMATSADAYQYGQCPAKVDFPERTFEPPAAVRGDIARTYWYMRDTYGIQIGRQQQQLFQAWAKADPVSAWERERNRRIARIQGSGNPYVESDTPGEKAQGNSQEKSGEKTEKSSSTEAPAWTKTRGNSSLEPERAAAAAFSCTPRKTCGKMRSCEEARYHLTQCGNTRLDGDGDGTPCEALCG